MMPISEAARHDLYNGLADVIGPERAETLMAYLPSYDPAEVATKFDIADLRIELKGDIANQNGDIADLKTGLATLNARMDRLFLTLLAGFFVVLAAIAGAVLAFGLQPG